MAKKKKSEAARVLIGIVTRSVTIDQTLTILRGDTVQIREVSMVVSDLRRNATGLVDVNNIGPGHLCPSVIVTLTNVENKDDCIHHVVPDSNIGSYIFKEIPIEDPAEEVAMSRE